MINNLITIFVSILPLLLLAFSWFVRPVWLAESDLKNKWSRILIQSTVISYLAGFLVFFMIQTVNLTSNYVISATNLFTSMAMLASFPILQSFYTDLKHRLVDRFILWVTTGLAMIIGGFSIYETNGQNHLMIISYLTLFAIASVILFIPAIGKSDGRSFQLLIATVFPVASFSGITTSMILFLAALFIYGIIISIKEKDLTILFKKRISMPMVPLIITPALVTILFSVAQMTLF